jgi:hypothetical protein
MAEGQTIPSGTTELAATNTAQQLTTESTIMTGLLVRAEKANGAVVRIGGSEVGASSYPLEAGESLAFDITDPTRVWLYGKEHDKVSYIELRP